VLAVAVLGEAMVLLEATVVNVALPVTAVICAPRSSPPVIAIGQSGNSAGVFELALARYLG
jgi:hypothetical protein